MLLKRKRKYPTIVINHLFIVLGWIWNRSVIHTDIVHECVYSLAHTLLHIRALNVKSYEKFVQLVQDAEFDILFSSPCQTQTILFLVIWCWVFCKLAKIVKISLVTRQSMAYIFILILYFRNLQTIYYQCKIGILIYHHRFIDIII